MVGCLYNNGEWTLARIPHRRKTWSKVVYTHDWPTPRPVGWDLEVLGDVGMHRLRRWQRLG
jgi:hypothetical protein